MPLFPALPILHLAVRNMVVCTLLASLSLLSAACGPRITNANLDVVEGERVNRDAMGRGIGPKEVESILGQPTRSETTKLALETQKKEVDVVRYYYVQDGEEVALHFVDGKLISSVPKLGLVPQTPVGPAASPAPTSPAPVEK